jgi:hypothetical protein
MNIPELSINNYLSDTIVIKYKCFKNLSDLIIQLKMHNSLCICTFAVHSWEYFHSGLSYQSTKKKENQDILLRAHISLTTTPVKKIKLSAILVVSQ